MQRYPAAAFLIGENSAFPFWKEALFQAARRDDNGAVPRTGEGILNQKRRPIILHNLLSSLLIYGGMICDNPYQGGEGQQAACPPREPSFWVKQCDAFFARWLPSAREDVAGRIK